MVIKRELRDAQKNPSPNIKPIAFHKRHIEDIDKNEIFIWKAVEMNIFKRIFFRKKKETTIPSTVKNNPEANGTVSSAPGYSESMTSSKEAIITPAVFDKLHDRYIAFDVETTGLNPSVDRIVEIGAVIFEKGEPVRSFSSMVNPGRHIPAEASRINGITDAMVRSAPSEHEVITKLAVFLEDALKGETYLCAHNAGFDMNFLVAALRRQHVKASIFYIDTLYLAKRYIDSDYVYNYKLGTLLSHFNIENNHLHRAEDDARGCGELAVKIFDLMTNQIEKLRKSYETSVPNEEELEICAVVQQIILGKGEDVSLLGYCKQSNDYVVIMYVFEILRFKIGKNKRYILINADAVDPDMSIKIEPGSKSEVERNYVRILFDNPSELYLIDNAIMKMYKREKENADHYIYSSKWAKNKYLSSPAMNNTIPNERVQTLVQSAEQRYKTRKAEEQQKKEELEEKAQELEKRKHERMLEQKERAERREAERIEKERLREEKKLQREQKLQAEKNPPTPSKPVLQYDREGNFICRYSSVKEAARSVSISPNGIRNVASGKAKTASGFIWSFAETNGTENKSN